MAATHVCLRRVEPARIWELIDDEGVTHYCGAPTVQIGIVNDPQAHTLARPVTVRGRRRAAVAHAARRSSRSSDSGPSTSTASPRRTARTPSARGTPSGTSCRADEQARMAARQGQGYVIADLVRVVGRHDARRPARRRDAGRGRHARQQRHEGLLRAAGRHRRGVPRAAGSTPATSPCGTRTATSSCATARRTSSSPAARTSRPSRSSRRWRSTRPCWSAPSSPIPDEKWGERPKAFVTLKPGAGGDRGGADRLLPGAHRPLQVPGRRRVRRPAEDLDRQGPEVRAARPRVEGPGEADQLVTWASSRPSTRR